MDGGCYGHTGGVFRSGAGVVMSKTTKEEAIELKLSYEKNWAFWDDKKRTSFIRKCRRVAKQVGNDDVVAIVAIDIIQTRSGRNLWPVNRWLKVVR